MNIIIPIYRGLLLLLPYKVVIQMTFAGQRIVNFVKYGDSYFPRGFAIEITSHCNRRCYYCPQSVEPTKVSRIKDDVYLKIVSRLVELKWKGPVDFNFYNEPLLDSRLEERIKMLLKFCPKAMPRVATNGDLLTEERTRSLLAAGVFNITVTQHPPYKPEWNARMADLVAKFPRRIQLHNIEDLELSNQGGLVSPKRVRSARLKREGCITPSCSHCISIDGDYIWCFADYKKTNLMGNVRDKSIKEAWFSEPWASYRRAVANGKPMLAVCKACFGEQNARKTSGVTAQTNR